MDLGNVTASETVSYVPELMMAIVVASAALCGLIGVIMGQVIQSQASPRERKSLIEWLSITLVLGVAAITFGYAWFSTPSTSKELGATISFGLHIWAFLILSSRFYLREARRQDAKRDSASTENHKVLRVGGDIIAGLAFLGILAWEIIRWLREVHKKETGD